MRSLGLPLLPALVLLLGCPSEPVEPKDDTGPVDTRTDADHDGWFDDEDCDDADPEVNPGAEEVCNEVDDDCDELIDEGVRDTWYRDADEDGNGDPDNTTEACEAPDGYNPFGSDCDDGDPEVYPAAVETCNGVDDNCDGQTDEGLLEEFYFDGDGDGYGDPDLSVSACEAPAGYVEYGGDCDDGDTAYHPGAAETDCADPNDYNCDGHVGYADNDGDGWASCEECDDGDATINPGADEYCDGVDNDCDGLIDEDQAVDADTWYFDADGDGYGNSRASTAACSQPAGYVANASDCNDVDAAIHPGADEHCNGDDDDCDGTIDEDDAVDAPTWYLDDDGDGYGDDGSTDVACVAPRDHVATGGDCDDTDASISPGQAELCDLVDQDCDGTVDDGVLGTATDCPAQDCTEVLADNPRASDGSYYMDDGNWWECEMSTDGGGWLEVSTAVQVWGTGYDTQYHNIAGFSWSEVLFRYDSGSSTAGCTYPTAIPSSNPITFQFGSEDWGLPAASCGTTCGATTVDYSASTTYLTTGYDFVIARAESTDTIRIGMLEGVMYCTTDDNWGYAWVDILIRR
jgi:hypothetical protein